MKTFDNMKSREIAAFNHNYSDTEKMLIEIRNKVHSENRPDSIQDLQELQGLITEYIDVLKDIVLTIHERSHFKETQLLTARNKEYNINAINSLETSLDVVKDRIKRRESEQLNSLPKSLKSVLLVEQLLKLRSLLIARDYISNIPEPEFIYLFREQPLKAGYTSIQWKKSKVKAKRLLNLIVGEGFSNPTANKCFSLYKKPKTNVFDSNVELTTSYPDIDDMIRQLK